MDKGRKPNELIQAGQDLSPLQLKTLLGMLTSFKYDIPIDSTDPSKEIVLSKEEQLVIADRIYNIPLETLVPNYKESKGGAVLSRARKQIKGLMAQSISVDEGDKLKDYNLVSSSVIDKGTSQVTAKFNYDIIPVLVNMVRKGYTEMSLEFIRELKSAYSIRIYELLLKNHRLSHVIKNGYKISVDDLRYLLGIDGDTYKNFADFKKRVLVQADKEINSDKTNLRYKYEMIRAGRKVTHIIFTDIAIVEPFRDTDGKVVKGIEQATLFTEDKNSPLQHLFAKDAAVIRKAHTPEYIEYYYKRCRRIEREGGVKKSFEGFFFKELTNDPKKYYERPKVEKSKKVVEDEVVEKTFTEKTDEAIVLFSELQPDEQARLIKLESVSTLFTDEETLKRMAALKYIESM